MDDAELVRQVLQGNLGVYAHLIDRYTGRVRALCLAMIGRADAVDDLVQEAFYRGLSNLRGLQQPDRFGYWLFGIARNLCHDWHNDPYHHHQVPLFDQPAPADNGQAERIADLKEAIAHLDPELREVLIPYYASRVTYAELAGQLGISLALVNQRLTRARKQLREWLKSPDDEDDEKKPPTPVNNCGSG